jgi:hypothetical protein
MISGTGVLDYSTNFDDEQVFRNVSLEVNVYHLSTERIGFVTPDVLNTSSTVVACYSL